jgi:hypothetical protein
MVRPIDGPQSKVLRERLRQRWAWDGGYWHPLNPQSRPFLIGLDASSLEKMLPEDRLRVLLEDFAPGELVLLHEYLGDSATTVRELTHLYGWSETFLAPFSLDWVVYWSHEDTIAFGGEGLVGAIKRAVPDLDVALWRPSA